MLTDGQSVNQTDKKANKKRQLINASKKYFKILHEEKNNIKRISRKLKESSTQSKVGRYHRDCCCQWLGGEHTMTLRMSKQQVINITHQECQV